MKRRLKKFVSLILIGCIATAMFSITAFAGQTNLTTSYNGFGASGYVKAATTSASALLRYEKSDKLKILLSTKWSDDGGIHYYYTNNSANTTGTSVSAYWSRAAGQTATSSTAYYYINGYNFATKTASV